MKEIQDFIEKSERFLLSADHLLKVEDYDSCVSRCYYAMFFMAEAALMTRGLSPSSHKGVITLFGKQFVKTGVFDQEMGRALRRAHDYRLTGDYAIGVSVGREVAEDLLQSARDFVSRVRSYLVAQGNAQT